MDDIEKRHIKKTGKRQRSVFPVFFVRENKCLENQLNFILLFKEGSGDIVISKLSAV